MKIITGAKCILSADGKTLTAVCDVADQPFNNLLITRVTHSHANALHPKHQRRIQSSNAAVFCEASQGKGKTKKAAISNDALADIFAILEPGTTFVPQLKKNSDGTVHVISETPVSFQWQVSTDNKVWTDIPGQTKAILDEAATKPGEWARLVVSNTTGSTISNPVLKPLPKPVPAEVTPPK